MIVLVTNDDPVNITGPNGWSAALNNSGLGEMAFDHTQWMDPTTSNPYTISIARNSWPTLAELLSAGIQVIIFMDTCADGSCLGIGSDPRILPEFDSVSEYASRVHHYVMQLTFIFNSADGGGSIWRLK